jgi:hypothetical protein
VQIAIASVDLCGQQDNDYPMRLGPTFHKIQGWLDYEPFPTAHLSGGKDRIRYLVFAQRKSGLAESAHTTILGLYYCT